MTECDCGRPVAPGSDVCAACHAKEVAQGLRPGGYGVRAHGETECEYQRRRRRARAAEGWCSTCSVNRASGVRTDGEPCSTCEACRHKAREDRDKRMRKGQCRHCTKLAQEPTGLCAGHRQRLVDYVNAHRDRYVVRSVPAWIPEGQYRGRARARRVAPRAGRDYVAERPRAAAEED